MEKNAEYAGQPLVHVIETPITVHYEDSDKVTVFGEFFTDRPSIDIFIIHKKVTTNYVLLRRATQHCWVNLIMERFILWVTMLLFAQKQLTGSCVW